MDKDRKTPKWLRCVLLLTGTLNMLGTILFVPEIRSFRELSGFPANSHPLYLWIIASWIFLFGLCYLWLGYTGRNERLFLVIGAAGKFAFVALMFAYALSGDIPLITAFNSLPDLVFAVTFVFWLWHSRRADRL